MIILILAFFFLSFFLRKKQFGQNYQNISNIYPQRFTCCLTLHGHIKIAEQQTIIQQYGDWYTGRWWVGCYIWYSEEWQGRAVAPPSPLIAVPNVTAHPSMASVPTSYYLMWHYNCLWILKVYIMLSITWQSFWLNTHMCIMSVTSNYVCSHAKHRRSGGWSAANSSAYSCVITKNSALMLSACMQ